MPDKKTQQTKKGDTVLVLLTGTLDNGVIFESSVYNGKPLQFTIGDGTVLPALEEAIEGMHLGESKTVSIPCDKAFGQHREKLIMEVDRHDLPGDVEMTTGLQLVIKRGDNDIPITVTDIKGDKVTINANHPLAGQDLTYKLELVKIKGGGGGGDDDKP